MKKWSVYAAVVALLVMSSMAFGQAKPEKPKSSRATSQKIIAAVNLYSKNQDTQGAIKGLVEALAKDPKNFYGNAWLGFLHLEAGTTEEAVSPLRTAHEVVPSDIGVLQNLAFALDRTNDRKGAYEAYQELNRAKPGDSTVLNKLGVFALDQGDVTGAIAYFEESDRLVPNDKVTTTNLATAYERAKQSEKARATYERLVALNPDNETLVSALSWLGFNAIQAGQYESAVGYLEKALALRENDLEILNNLGNAYGNLKPAQDAKSMDIYRRMVALNPDLYEPWYNLGVLYLKQNQADNAVEANLNALKRKPDEPFALNNLGRAYEMQGRFAMAGDNYAKAS